MEIGKNVEDYILNVINKQKQINEEVRKQSCGEELKRQKAAEETYKQILLTHASLCTKCCSKPKCELCKKNLPKITLNCVVCATPLEDVPQNITTKNKLNLQDVIETMQHLGADINYDGFKINGNNAVFGCRHKLRRFQNQ